MKRHLLLFFMTAFFLSACEASPQRDADTGPRQPKSLQGQQIHGAKSIAADAEEANEQLEQQADDLFEE